MSFSKYFIMVLSPCLFTQVATVEKQPRNSIENGVGEMLDRQPPRSIEAERAVIGSLLLLPEACDEVVDPIAALGLLEEGLPDLQLEHYQNLYEPTIHLHDIVGCAYNHAGDRVTVRFAHHQGSQDEHVESSRR